MADRKFVIVGATAPDIVKLIAAVIDAGKEQLACEGFLDDNTDTHGKEFMGYPILGSTAELKTRFQDHWVVNNVARDMPTREKVVNRLKSLGVTKYLTLIHPSVDTRFVTIGAGCVLQEGVILGPLSSIGDHSILYAHAIVGHECTIGEITFIGNNAIVGARGEVGRGAFIGLNSVILPSLRVGPWSTIGAGSVVLKNVEERTSVFGNPARAAVRPAAVFARP